MDTHLPADPGPDEARPSDKARPSIARLFAIGLAVAAAILALLLALPHDPAIRWQAERTEAYARFGWIHQRLHDDPTPVDVALIGTSHTLNGIDGLAVARTLAATGVRGEGGRCLTVTNLAIPAYGRNTHWLIARELLATRRPKAIVLEVFENETRKAHPLFSHIATSRDLVTAPVLLNMNYASDLVRLPYRQASLAVESLWPRAFGLRTRFDPRDYDGSTVDNTRFAQVDGRALTPSLAPAMDPHALERAAADHRAHRDLNMLPRSLERYEYAVPWTYVGKIMAQARETGTPVYLLYLPSYGMGARPADLRPFGTPQPLLLDVNDIIVRRDLWHDPAHLNTAGAVAVSARLGAMLARTPALAGLPRGEPSDRGCDFGYPERASVIPWSKPHA